MTDGDEDTVVRRERFSGGPAREFLSSMAADEHLFEADLAVDRAHVVMLAEQAIIDEEEAGQILGALDTIESQGFDALPAGEDIHEAIETAVIDEIGPVGGKLHTARSRNDEVATCIRYQLRSYLIDVIDAVLDVREALAAVAREHTETVMPGYTHLQPAQPTTVAHFLLSYEQAVARDTERLLAAFERTNQSPLGGAAFAGTPFDIDRERTAELLGFDGVIGNSTDAVATRDFLVETAGALATLSITLSGIAEDLVIFANKGLIELADDYASTSSIMPQKKNPDTLELVRATAGDTAATFQGLLTTLKGLPRAYNRDLQKATPHVWETIAEITDASYVAAGAVATADWNEDALASAAGEGFSTATGIADKLAMAGLPFRTAHEIVAEAAEIRSEGEAADLADSGVVNGEGESDVEETEAATLAAIETATEAVTGDELDDLVDVEALAELLDPLESVAVRDSHGGPAPSVVRSDLTEVQAKIEGVRNELAQIEADLDVAADSLAEVITGYE